MKAPDARMTRSAVISGAATAAAASFLAPTAASAGNKCCNLINLDLKAGGGESSVGIGCAAPPAGTQKLSNVRLVGVKCGEKPPTIRGYTLEYVIADAGIMGTDEIPTQHGSTATVDGYKHMKQNLFVYVKT